MTVEEGGRWQIVCRHGVVVATLFTRPNGCVRLACEPIAQAYVSLSWWIEIPADFKEAESVGRACALRCGKEVSSTVSL